MSQTSPDTDLKKATISNVSQTQEEEINTVCGTASAAESDIGSQLYADPPPLRHPIQAVDQLAGWLDSSNFSDRSPAGPSSESMPVPDVDGYDVLELLGSGGMGLAYKARQKGLDRLVALKLIREGPWASDEQRRRFRVEAQAAARLQHPNIVQIHEVIEYDGCPCLVLELVDGESLNHRLAAGPMNPRAAAEMVRSLAVAAHFAHRNGILHRDLKPGNVLVSRDGTPKISDFGLAKYFESNSMRGSSAGHCPERLTEFATRTGQLLGTPNYMAPEQANGNSDSIGPATDTYALGTILYEALTGRPPFLAASVMEILDQVRNQDPVRLSRLQPRLPRDLQTV